MKPNFHQEITKCFCEQYPKKEKEYLKLIRGNFKYNLGTMKEYFKILKAYNDMIVDISFLIKLIIKLEND